MKKQDKHETATPQEQTEELINACGAGDRQAMEKLATWCLPRVRRTVMLTYGAGPDRDDLVQNAMSRVIFRLHTFRGDASFFIWVDRIAINVVKDHFKKRKFVIFNSDIADDARMEDAPGHTAPDRDYERYRLFERLQKHFEAIHPKRRIPLVLSLFQGYTIPEIAAMLDLSFDAAKMRLRRGRRDLLKRMKSDPYCRQMIRELVR